MCKCKYFNPDTTGGRNGGELLHAGRQQDECICTVLCSMSSTKITSSTQEALTGIKYCPGTEVELPKYFHVEYKESIIRSWPVQYQYFAGRVKEEVSIPRVEIRDVSLEQDDQEEVNGGAQSW